MSADDKNINEKWAMAVDALRGTQSMFGYALADLVARPLRKDTRRIVAGGIIDWAKQMKEIGDTLNALSRLALDAGAIDEAELEKHGVLHDSDVEIALLPLRKFVDSVIADDVTDKLHKKDDKTGWESIG
jgi:hypothetical protein